MIEDELIDRKKFAKNCTPARILAKKFHFIFLDQTLFALAAKRELYLGRVCILGEKIYRMKFLHVGIRSREKIVDIKMALWRGRFVIW